MSKELEALNHIGNCYVANEGKDLWISDDYGEDYDIIEKGLQRLEAIENANPSEALKKLEKYLKWLERNEFFIEISNGKYVKCVDIIKPTLLKAQEQDKVLEIIKKKKVDIRVLRNCLNAKDETPKHYNFIRDKHPLTEEEFDLLKEVLTSD